MPRIPVRLLLLVLLLAPATHLHADIFKPFTTSNLNPFVQVHGLPVTRSAAIAKESEFDWHLQTEFASNFTRAASGTETIAIDGETHRATLALRYGLTDRVELGLDIPYLRHRGGSLDNFIENWHNFWGLPNGGREDVAQDQLVYAYRSGGADFVDLRRGTSGIGDITLHGAYLLGNTDTRTWTLRAGAKLPVGDADKLTGSEATDFFASIHLSEAEFLQRQNLVFHGSLGLLMIGDADVLEDMVEDQVLFGSAMVGWQASERISLKAQLDVHSAVYDSDLDELGDFSAQLVFGGSIRLGRQLLLDISVSEDVTTDSSPDVIFQFGLHSDL